MGDAPDPPPPPDPVKTAQAQAGMNRDAAQAQQYINATNQVTPDGKLTYSKSGTFTYIGADGKPVTIDQLTATQTLSPEQQKIYDTNQATKGQIAQIGLDQSKRIGELLGTPVDLSNDAVEGRINELASKRLNPQLAQQEEALRTRLANQGLQPGSQAWNAEMDRFGQTSNDARNQLLLNGRAQSVQEILAQRNQPINEISALLSGSQVSQPNFVGTPQASVGAPDYTGLVSQNYQAQLGAWNAQNQANSSMMGGLFGLAAAPFQMFKFSDRRLKTDIRRLDATLAGFPLYAFRYVWGGPEQVGVMAQDVARSRPDAVAVVDGYLAVDYAAIGG